MKAFIKNDVKNYGKSKEIRYDAWGEGKLNFGLVIEFFDADCLIPKNVVRKKIKCLEWLELYINLKESYLKGLDGINTQDRVLLIGPDDLDCK